jgi:uncharacterized membrane protein YkvA (DUF1232 family)
MSKAYKKTAQVGIIKACLRFIEDPNRSLIQRVFLALSPLLAVWILSPLDLMPEIILGPLGLTDDILILIGLFLLIRLAHNFYKEKRYVKPQKRIDEADIIDL